MVFIEFLREREEFIHKKCHRQITDDNPDGIQVSPDENIVRRNGKIKMKPLVQRKNNKVQRKDAFHDIHDFFRPGSVVMDHKINEGKSKVVRRDLGYIINR
jgi:hypothetical protein